MKIFSKAIFHFAACSLLLYNVKAATSISNTQFSGFTVEKAIPTGSSYIILGRPWTSSLTLTGCTSDISITRLFVGLYNPGSNCWNWAYQTPTGVSAFIGNNLGVDASGNVFIAGSFQGTVTFDASNSKTSAGNWDIFLLKLTSTGVIDKLITVGTAEKDVANYMTLDNSGNVYVSGMYNFDQTNANKVNGATQSSIFIGKYNNSCTKIWSYTYKGSASDNYLTYTEAYGLAVDGSGNVYQTGTISGSVTFGKGISISSGGQTGSKCAFLAKYNSSGAALWAISPGSQSTGSYVALDANGGVYGIGGFWNTTLKFSNTITLNNTTNSSWTFLTKYNTSGTAQWAKKLTTGTNGLMASANNNAFVWMSISKGNTYTFDGSTSSYTATRSGFVMVEYSTSGSFVNAEIPKVSENSTHSSTYTGSATLPYNTNIVPVNNGYIISGQVSGATYPDSTYDKSILTLDSVNVIEGRKSFFAIYSNSAFKTNTGMEAANNETDGFIAYPNPFTGMLSLKTRKTANLQLLGLDGKVYKNLKTQTGNNSFDLSAIPPGFYLLKNEETGVVIKLSKN